RGGMGRSQGIEAAMKSGGRHVRSIYKTLGGVLECLVKAPTYLLDVFGWRQPLRHHTTDFLDSLAHLSANLEMRAVRRFLALHLVPTQLLFGLRRAKQVSCE